MAPPDGTGSQPVPRRKILVVEDDEAMRYFLTRVLRGAGYDTLEAATGKECLRAARQHRPDVILLDVYLPDGSGVDACKQLKADPELLHCLVIQLSGVAVSADSQADALDAGADGYLTKPVHERTLLSHVRALLRIKQAEAALVNQQEHELRSLQPPQAAAPVPPDSQALVAHYGVLLDQATEQRTHRVTHPLSEGLRALAADLYASGTGARQVVDLHLAALKPRVTGVPASRSTLFVEEGRLLLIELLGHLLSRYQGSEAAA